MNNDRDMPLPDGCVEITGIDLGLLIREAYALSRPQGMGLLHYSEGPLPDREVEEILGTIDGSGLHMDYVLGRSIKMNVFPFKMGRPGSASQPFLDGRKYTYDSWHDHSPRQLAELLGRLGIDLAVQMARQDAG